MTTLRSSPAALSSQALGQARASWRDDLVTVLAGLWLTTGLFVDGWAHRNVPRLESFFTPWHGVFYSGFLAVAAWMGWLVVRELRAGRTGLAAVPRGYEWGLVGLGVFGLGAVGDAVWHTVFGIERDRAALLSPSHLLLLLGAELILLSPFASAWHARGRSSRAPSLGAFLPALLSLTAAFGFAAFMNGYHWPLVNVRHAVPTMAALTQRGGQELASLATDLNLVGILFATLVVLAPVLIVLRRFQPPFGSFAVLLTANALLGGLVADAAAQLVHVATAVLGGLLIDGLIRWLRPWPERPLHLRAFAALAPLGLWGLHFALVGLATGSSFPPELWAGITVQAGLCGLVLGFLVAPPPVPPLEG